MQADFTDLLRDGSARRAAHAYRNYKGRFLAHASSSYAVEIEHWRDEIEEDVANTVAILLAEQAFVCADSELPDLIRVARQVLAEHPYARQAQIAILECFARAGDQAEVERLYSAFERTTDNQFDPLPQLDQFVRRFNLSLQPKSARLAGRDDEIATLHRLWDQATAGCGQFVVLMGESGIGKTRVAEHLLRRIALRGGSIWIARCCAATQRLPYSAVTELVRDNLPDDQVNNVIQTLNLVTSVGSEGRQILTEVLTAAVLSTSNQRPLAILIDDAQWADDFTALLLTYWSYRLREQRVLTILTVRTEEADPLPNWLSADLTRPYKIRLGPIRAEAACDIANDYELANRVTLHRELRDQAIWKSAGRPFLLLEALHSIAATLSSASAASALLSDSAELVLRRRFNNLPKDASAVLSVLAVHGQAATTESLEFVSGLNGSRLAAAIDVLHNRGVATWSGGQVIFVHDLMRETAYRSCLPATRAHFHRRWAKYLARSSAPPGLTVHHYLSAGIPRRAAAYASAAANAAYRLHSYDEYEYYMKLCIEHGSLDIQRSCATELARYFIQVGRTKEIENYQNLLKDDAKYRLLLSILDMERELTTGARDAAALLALADKIVELGSDEHDPSAASVLATILDVSLDAGSSEFGSKVVNRLLTDREPAFIGEARAAVLSVAAVWKAVTESTSAALPLGAEALANADHASLPTRSLCLSSYATVLLLSGKLDEAIKHFRSALSVAVSAGDIRRQYVICINNGIALFESGSDDLARQCFERVLTAPSIQWRVRAFGNLAILHYENGDLKSAHEAAKALLAINAVYQSGALDNLGNAICGLVDLQKNDVDSAIRHSLSIRIQDYWDFGSSDLSYPVALLSRLWCEQGRSRRALALLNTAEYRVGPHDTLCALRLMFEKVVLMSHHNVADAITLNHELMRRAADIGAKRIHDQSYHLMKSLLAIRS